MKTHRNVINEEDSMELKGARDPMSPIQFQTRKKEPSEELYQQTANLSLGPALGSNEETRCKKKLNTAGSARYEVATACRTC
jgi:hypothetical protein